MRVGYARVSTREQNLDLQIDALRGAGCSRIFEEKLSATATLRPGLAAAIKAVSVGDQLVVWKLDRFARNLLDQLLLLRDLQRRGASLLSLTETIDTSDWMGDVMSRQLGIYAEVELGRIRERTRAGVARAMANGVRFGRAAKMTAEQAAEARLLIEGGMKAETVAARFQVGRSTLFRHLKASRSAIAAIGSSP